jgi:ribosomal protein S18 acetylase RimI-like enzyme
VGNSSDDELLAVGVAPAFRRRGLATRLLSEHLATIGAGRTMTVTVSVGERDVVEPLDHDTRIAIARRLLGGAGFEIKRAPDLVVQADSRAFVGIRR